MRLRGSEQSKHAISTLECAFSLHLDFGMVFVAAERENARMTQTQTRAHTLKKKRKKEKQREYIHNTHTYTQTHTQTYTHRKIAGCSRILIRTADGCKRFLFSLPLFFFKLSRSVVDDSSFCHINTCATILILTSMCRFFFFFFKVQRDGDEYAPAAVGADCGVYRWLLLE